MTRKLLISTAFAFAFVVGASVVAPALAQDVSYKKETKYDFDDDTVEGDLVKPDGEMIGSAGKVKHSSLIKIRQHFIPEMLKSAEDI